eukprot:6859026-Pyramimonas_sp.AAC.1
MLTNPQPKPQVPLATYPVAAVLGRLLVAAVVGRLVEAVLEGAAAKSLACCLGVRHAISNRWNSSPPSRRFSAACWAVISSAVSTCFGGLVITTSSLVWPSSVFRTLRRADCRRFDWNQSQDERQDIPSARINRRTRG